ncbi:MAG: thiamine pyrophosphate-binding protein [Deltaproteobacteria bacterium]|nr:thiamine pyrophosphate-binding protein [Deltaproteobacteria bacterium]
MEAPQHPHFEPQTVPDPTRTADVLVDILVAAGVEVVFGLPGGTISPIYDALLDRPRIRVITTRHESGAMFAAAAYARATGKLGVVLVTSGPGVINTMTGLASAHCDGLPVLVLAGEVPRAVFGKHALQEGTAHHLDIVSMAKHITKLAIQVTEPNGAPAVLRRTIATALSGRRGPALLTLPLDLLSAPIVAPELSYEIRSEMRVNPAAITRAADALERAHRPIIFAGSGARWGNGPARLAELAHRLQIPVITTPKAKGVFPEHHRLALGVFGHGGHPSATAYLEDGIDCILAVGTGFSDPATDGWSPLLKASRDFIQIDADALQIGRNYPVTQGLVGPAETVLSQLLDALPAGTRAVRRFGLSRHLDPATMGDGEGGLISPERALWELQRVMPPGTAYTCDIGEHLLFATHYLEINDPQGFLIMTGLASMGTGMAGALGLKLAMPRRPVAAVVGDGCFSMGLGDLQTAVHERIPLLVVVLNDHRYGMVELGHGALFGRTPAFGGADMNVVELAQGVGAQILVARHTGDILASNVRGLLANGPVVLNVDIDPTARMPKNKRFETLGRVTRRPRLVN